MVDNKSRKMAHNSSTVVKWRGRRRMNLAPLPIISFIVSIAIAEFVLVQAESSSTGHSETASVTPLDAIAAPTSVTPVATSIYKEESVPSGVSNFDGKVSDGVVLGEVGVAGLNQQYYPTVNKCCPFFSRYEAGECVQAQPNTAKMMTMTNQQFWEAPKAMVTLLSKDLDGMEISNDTVVFR